MPGEIPSLLIEAEVSVTLTGMDFYVTCWPIMFIEHVTVEKYFRFQMDMTNITCEFVFPLKELRGEA